MTQRKVEIISYKTAGEPGQIPDADRSSSRDSNTGNYVPLQDVTIGDFRNQGDNVKS
jgi:hypothetical protein